MMMLNVISTLVIDMMLQKIYSSLSLELSSWSMILPLVYDTKEVIPNVIQIIGKKELLKIEKDQQLLMMMMIFKFLSGFYLYIIDF